MTNVSSGLALRRGQSCEAKHLYLPRIRSVSLDSIDSSAVGRGMTGYGAPERRADLRRVRQVGEVRAQLAQRQADHIQWKALDGRHRLEDRVLHGV